MLFSGLFTVGGFVSTDCLPQPPETGEAAHSQTIMIFGPNGFFAYTPYTTGEVDLTRKHTLGDATVPPGQMAFWWSRSAQKDCDANPDESALKRELRSRHGSCKDPTINKILQSSDVTLKVPTFVLPKMPTWAGQRIVLVGDAAHGKFIALDISSESQLTLNSITIVFWSGCFSMSGGCRSTITSSRS